MATQEWLFLLKVSLQIQPILAGGQVVRQGYTQREAEELVDHVFETQVSLTRVPRLTRGRVIGVIDAGDHWNVLIEWELPRLSVRDWYDKFDVTSSMRRLSPESG